MLMISIIDQLSKQLRESPEQGSNHLLSYFICQGTDSRLDNASDILRGLIYLLEILQPLLLRHLRQQYDQTGGELFDRSDLFYALSGVFQSMLQNPNFLRACFIVDAIDECSVEMLPFLDLLRDTVAKQSSRVKWIISSRNRDDIERCLQLCNSHERLSLELNAKQLSRFIIAFISLKVTQLFVLRNDGNLQLQVASRINQKAECTFLQASLVFKRLEEDDIVKSDILEVIEQCSTGLIPLYDRMTGRIRRHKGAQRCFLTLSTAILAYRPLHLLKLHTIASFLDAGIAQTELEGIITMCSSFLNIREQFVYFIHQSAKDYLTQKKLKIIFPAGPEAAHYDIFSLCLSSMSISLRWDIYDLNDPGIIRKGLAPIPDPIAHIRYSCLFWFDHLRFREELSDYGKLHAFMQRHFLHWLEALSHSSKIA